MVRIVRWLGWRVPPLRAWLYKRYGRWLWGMRTFADEAAKLVDPELQKWFDDTESLGNMLKQVEKERGVRR
jgi:hypothetical protein